MLFICSVLVGRSFPAPAAERTENSCDIKSKVIDTINSNEPTKSEDVVPVSNETADSVSTDTETVENTDADASASEAASSDAKEPLELPQGYKSLCYPMPTFTAASSSVSALTPYRAEFKTNDPAGVNPVTSHISKS